MPTLSYFYSSKASTFLIRNVYLKQSISTMQYCYFYSSIFFNLFFYKGGKAASSIDRVLTPPTSLYDRRFISYSQTKNQSSFGQSEEGGTKLHQLRSRSLNQVKWQHPQVCTTNSSWDIANRINQILTNQKRGWGCVTPIEVKDSEPSQMTPPTRLYNKRFISYSQTKDQYIIDQSEEGVGLIFKMDDFLFDFGHGTKTFLYGHDTRVYWFSCFRETV